MCSSRSKAILPSPFGLKRIDAYKEVDAVILQVVTARHETPIKGVSPIKLAVDMSIGLENKTHTHAGQRLELGVRRIVGLDVPTTADIEKRRDHQERMMLLAIPNRHAKFNRSKNPVISEDSVLYVAPHCIAPSKNELLNVEKRTV